MAQQYELRDNSGTAFKNEKPEGDTLKPDYRGKSMINGKEMQVAIWIKQGKNGKFLSLSFQEPYVKPAGEPAKANGYISDELESDIPF